MAANKFATTLHRNSNKITEILVYAFLEWLLISFLLLNSLFVYLISKFASYFGLKPPFPPSPSLLPQSQGGGGRSGCTGCSFVDQVYEHHDHDISRLNHRWLADSSFRDNRADSATIAFVTFTSQKDYHGGDGVSRCSCCSDSGKGERFAPFMLFKPSWNNMAFEGMANDNDIQGGYKEPKKMDELSDRHTETCQEVKDRGREGGGGDEHQVLSDIESFGIREASEEDCFNSKSASSSLWFEKEETPVNDKEAGSDCSDKISCGSSNQSQILDGSILKYLHVEECSLEDLDLGMSRDEVCEDQRLIPVEMIDASTNENTKLHILVEEHLRKCHHPGEDLCLKSMIEAEISLLEESFIVDKSVRKAAYDEMRNLDDDAFRPGRFPFLASDVGEVQLVGMPIPGSGSTFGDLSLFPIHEDFVVATMEDANKIIALEDRTRIHGTGRDLSPRRPGPYVSAMREADIPTEDCNDAGKLLQGVISAEGDGGSHDEGRAIYYARPHMKTPVDFANYAPIPQSEPEGQEEVFPETLTSADSIDYMQKRSPRNKSARSRKEDDNNLMTIQQLSAALEAERKSLHALCLELEEERNASAVAASQTMAMITRLQEEKAAMQMEALQYQRMMEEQSEYDQEALQLLNELMIKREKEKQELEKELEACRKKVLEHETKPRIGISMKFNSECLNSFDSSVSGNADEGHDEMVAGSDHGSSGGHCATPTNEVLDLEELALDCVKHMSSLDDSLVDFEEERQSILDQLRALEEKLLTMSSSKGSHDKGTVTEQYAICDGKESNEGQDSGFVADYFKEESNLNLLHGNESMCDDTWARRLLPLLDADENEADREEIPRENPELGYCKVEPSSSGSISESDGQKLGIEKEVDIVYERLQALEADREFLKNCVSSIKQGDKGMSLLQEKLQHLRDLKSVELGARCLDV